jgi:hypothetical protein
VIEDYKSSRAGNQVVTSPGPVGPVAGQPGAAAAGVGAPSSAAESTPAAPQPTAAQ